MTALLQVVDPARALAPVGDAWVGVVVPALLLGVSAAVGFFLYWHFTEGGGRRPEKP